jgi:hypothetical protein
VLLEKKKEKENAPKMMTATSTEQRTPLGEVRRRWLRKYIKTYSSYAFLKRPFLR